MKIKERLKIWWNGLRDEEWLALDTVRSLYQLLSTAPALAQRLFDLLPAILIEMKRLERAMPESGRGRERLGQLTSWIETEHGEGLQRVAQMGEILAAVRALATLIVSILKAAGVMQK